MLENFENNNNTTSNNYDDFEDEFTYGKHSVRRKSFVACRLLFYLETSAMVFAVRHL